MKDSCTVCMFPFTDFKSYPSKKFNTQKPQNLKFLQRNTLQTRKFKKNWNTWLTPWCFIWSTHFGDDKKFDTCKYQYKTWKRKPKWRQSFVLASSPRFFKRKKRRLKIISKREIFHELKNTSTLHTEIFHRVKTNQMEMYKPANVYCTLIDGNIKINASDKR